MMIIIIAMFGHQRDAMRCSHYHQPIEEGYEYNPDHPDTGLVCWLDWLYLINIFYVFNFEFFL